MRNKTILKKYTSRSTKEITNRVTVTYGLAEIKDNGEPSSDVVWNQDFELLMKHRWFNYPNAKDREFIIFQKLSTTRIEPIFKVRLK
jgi:hypothetical protein